MTMSKFPSRVSVRLMHQHKTGLFAAVSDDLPGLMTIADSIEEVDRRLPASIAQVIQAQYGQRVEVVLEDDFDDDFQPLDAPRVLELRAA